MSKRLAKVNEIYAGQSQTYHLIDFARNLSLVIILLGINVVVFYQTFEGAITIGEMVLIIQLVIQARRPLFAMSFILTQLQNAESGSKEYFTIMDLPAEEKLNLLPLSKNKIFSKPGLRFDKIFSIFFNLFEFFGRGSSDFDINDIYRFYIFD